jgi:hypothetical protein
MPIIVDSPQEDDEEYLTLEQAVKAGWFPWLVDEKDSD